MRQPPESDDRVVVMADWLGRTVEHPCLSDQAWKNAIATGALVPPTSATTVWLEAAAITGWVLATAAACAVAYWSFAGWPDW